MIGHWFEKGFKSVQNQRHQPADSRLRHRFQLEPVDDQADLAALLGTLARQREPPVDEILFSIDNFFHRN